MLVRRAETVCQTNGATERVIRLQGRIPDGPFGMSCSLSLYFAPIAPVVLGG